MQLSAAACVSIVSKDFVLIDTSVMDHHVGNTNADLMIAEGAEYPLRQKELDWTCAMPLGGTGAIVRPL